MAEMKAFESKVDSDFESNPKRGKRIINAEPSANVKGALLHFIVDSSIKKNMISIEVIKWLDLGMTPHL
jgi:hypothetical protein